MKVKPVRMMGVKRPKCKNCGLALVSVRANTREGKYSWQHLYWTEKACADPVPKDAS